mmetsp:Transcript_133448/g.372060  ORF Transcript_133448/g.372060 Transcript_133448/m.372060 type:complete len:445 (+) Transcript_133448:1066-2400(+)
MCFSSTWLVNSAFRCCFSTSSLLALRRSRRSRRASFSCTSSSAMRWRRSTSSPRARSAGKRARTSRSTPLRTSCALSFACRSSRASCRAAARSRTSSTALELPSGSALPSKPGRRCLSSSSCSLSSAASFAWKVATFSRSSSASLTADRLDSTAPSRSRRASASCCCARSRCSATRASSSPRAPSCSWSSARSSARVLTFSLSRCWVATACFCTARMASRESSAMRLCRATSACRASTCNVKSRWSADFSRTSLLHSAVTSFSLARNSSERRSASSFSRWTWASACCAGRSFEAAMFFSWRYWNFSILSCDTPAFCRSSSSDSFAREHRSAACSSKSRSHCLRASASMSCNSWTSALVGGGAATSKDADAGSAASTCKERSLRISTFSFSFIACTATVSFSSSTQRFVQLTSSGKFEDATSGLAVLSSTGSPTMVAMLSTTPCA